MTGLELVRFIRDEHIKLRDKATLVSFRWFVGIDLNNTPKVFRYLKGGDLSRWSLATSEYKKSYGPFKTMKEANTFLNNRLTVKD